MKTKLLVSALVIAAVVIGFIFWKSHSETAADSTGAQAQQAAVPPTEVTVATIKAETITFTKDLPGRTSAYRVAEIRPQVSGIITKRLFKEGSNVKEGQQLYQIDPAPFQAAYESAQAELLRAEANLTSAAPRVERYSELVKVGGVSKQEYDDSVTTLAQAKAAVAVAKAAVTSAKINLDYTKVFSPISGHIGKSSVTEGALVTANQAVSLALVQQLDQIYVDVNQSAGEVMKLRRMVSKNEDELEDSASVTLLPEGSDDVYKYKGRMQFSDVTVDETTGKVQLRILFPNPDQELLPGLFVKTRVNQYTQDNAILVPQQAVVRTGNDITTWVVADNNTVSKRAIQVSQAIGNKWLVTEGVKDGERVVVQGLQKIRENAKVNPVEMIPAQN